MYWAWKRSSLRCSFIPSPALCASFNSSFFPRSFTSGWRINLRSANSKPTANFDLGGIVVVIMRDGVGGDGEEVRLLLLSVIRWPDESR